MVFAFDGYNYTLRFERGELIIENLVQFIKDQQIGGGWVVGLGGLAWAELGFYDLAAKEYDWKKFDTLLELTNLTGNIAWQHNQTVLHLHATISDASFHAHGGHLKEAEAAGTVEVFIHRWLRDEGLQRSKDEATGLNLLDL